MPIRVECCATKKIADGRRGYLETRGFVVTVKENDVAIKMKPQAPDDIDGSEYLFDGEPCTFLLVAIK